MAKIKVMWSNPRTEEDGEFSDEPYSSRPDTYGSLEIEGYRVANEKDKNSYYGDLATIKEDKGTVFAIFSCYDSGNSFGHDSNYFQFIEAFSDAKRAEIALAQIDKCIKNKQSLVKFTNDVGEEREVYLSGMNDYFGGLNGIEIRDVYKDNVSTRKITYH
jgi:hypothetical protein